MPRPHRVSALDEPVSDLARRGRADFHAVFRLGLLLVGLSGCAAAAPDLVDPVRARKATVMVGGAALVPLSKAASGEADELELVAKPAGVTPVVRSTVPLGGGVSALFRYGGRDLGGGAHFAFWDKRTESGGGVTAGVGLEGSFVLVRPESSRMRSLAGGGGEIPLFLTWASDSGIYLAWLSSRAGYGVARAVFETGELSVKRFFARSALGLGLGFRSLHVLAELGIQHDRLSGGGSTANVWSLSPAFALSFKP